MRAINLIKVWDDELLILKAAVVELALKANSKEARQRCERLVAKISSAERFEKATVMRADGTYGVELSREGV